MSSVIGLYALIFVAVFVGALAVFMMAPVWLAVVTLVGGVPVLFWWIRRW